MDNDANLLALLKSRFGYESFLPLQSEIIGNVLARRDSLALMPTGGGKSLCYQLPALVFGGVTLVVSPLIALMKDQVDALNANGIAARFINSSLPAGEVGRVQAQVLRGQIKLLYVAPERLALPGFRRFLHGLDLSLIAIDEAHCISEWGHEFRPDYRNLRQLRDDFPATPAIALTATATQRVRDDIIAQLGLQQGRVFLSSFDRCNLSYWVWPRDGARERLLPLLERHRSQSAIIYCFSRQETETLAADLNARGLPARAYHAGLDSDTRRRTQEDFVRDRVPIIVATIAFGMGIDKPDVRLVVHHNLPKSLEGYYQETGRAGRDGLPSQCVLIYSYADKARQDHFINQIEDAQEQRNAREKLARMVEFAQLTSCRRRFMLEYLGERRAEESCGGCDVCLEPREEFDATEIAQKVLSAVIRTGERFGANHVIQVLSGSREKRILEMGHERLSVHGIARDYGRPQLREIIGLLQERGLLVRSEGEYPTLAVAPEGRELLRGRQPLSLPRPIGADGAGAPGARPQRRRRRSPTRPFSKSCAPCAGGWPSPRTCLPTSSSATCPSGTWRQPSPRAWRRSPVSPASARSSWSSTDQASWRSSAPTPRPTACRTGRTPRHSRSRPAREPGPRTESGGSGASAPPTTPHGSFCPGGCPSPRWRSFAAWRRPQSWATWNSWPLGATSWTCPTSCRRRTGSAR